MFHNRINAGRLHHATMPRASIQDDMGCTVGLPTTGSVMSVVTPSARMLV
jgi:hypothetical protein